MPWRRERLPTPIFWPGEFYGLYSLWGCKESDMTKQLSVSHMHIYVLFHINRNFQVVSPKSSKVFLKDKQDKTCLLLLLKEKKSKAWSLKIIRIWCPSIKFFVVFFFGHTCCMWNFLGSNPCPLQWKCRVLTTGPPEKFTSKLFKNVKA